MAQLNISFSRGQQRATYTQPYDDRTVPDLFAVIRNGQREYRAVRGWTYAGYEYVKDGENNGS